MSRITFEVPQAKHPFVGLGDGIIITQNGKEEPKIIIKFPLHGIEITTATGDDAKRVMVELNKDDWFDDEKIEYAKNMACDTTGIDKFTLTNSKQNQRAVFARYLVWDYAKNSLSFSLKKCGELFNNKNQEPLDHSTVHRALRYLRKENYKYMTVWQQIAYNAFWKSMKEYSEVLTEE